MVYSNLVLAQMVVHLCEKHQIENVIISPGSRNAPLIIGFHNNEKINTLSVVDERSAAFFALGIAQQTQKPVALVCTSGSALLNYYPAIAEAYFSNIPLIILSADRPNHLLNIGDGQTINQQNVFQNHILKSVNLTDDKSLFNENFHEINDAFVKSIELKGPIHINIPFDEPLYETTHKQISFPKIPKKIKVSLLDEEPLEVDELSDFAEIWNRSTKKMVLIGVNYPSDLIQIQINHLLKDESVLVLTETTSNIYHHKIINGIDKLLVPLDKNEIINLKPDVLLTFGGMIVSKKIKHFFRTNKPNHHWHIDKKNALNTYHSLSHHFKVSAELFFSQFFFLTKPKTSNYQKTFLAIFNHIIQNHQKFIQQVKYSDLKVFDTILKNIPNNYQLQLSNSATIRYTQLFHLKNNLHVFCNRGTSGIDGSTSTAIGAAYVSTRKTLFITGDISFYYDSNAFWNNYLSKDLRIIIINNAGGGIFRFIPGPQKSNALPLFETSHILNAHHLCKMHGLSYYKASNIEEVNTLLKSFYENSKSPKVLEIFTPKNINDKVLKDYFKNL